MTFDPASMIRPAVRVARVAELLDCSVRQVHALIEAGELEGFGLGQRRRVYADSVEAYQLRRPIKIERDRNAPKHRAANPQHTAAETILRRAGILP